MSFAAEKTAEEWKALCASQQRWKALCASQQSTVSTLSRTLDLTLERLDQMERERDSAVKRTPRIARAIIAFYEAKLDLLRGGTGLCRGLVTLLGLACAGALGCVAPVTLFKERYWRRIARVDAMSAPAERTAEEWAALCASQQQTIRDLEKERLERGTHVNKMKRVVQEMQVMMDDHIADFQGQMTAAQAVIASLKVFKERYEAVVGECRALSAEAALVEHDEQHLEALVKASQDAGRF